MKGITEQAFTKLTGTDNYGTPIDVVDYISEKYVKAKFVIDACASNYNAKCDVYFTKQDNMFEQQLDETFFMNPIYGKKGYRTVEKGTMYEHQIYNEYGTGDFLKFARDQHFKHNSIGAVLLFANTSSSKYIHNFVGETPEDRIKNECELFLYPRRISFDEFEHGVKIPNGTPAMSSYVVVYDSRFGRK